MSNVNLHDLEFAFYDATDERHRNLGDQLEAMRLEEDPTMFKLGSEIMAQHIFGVIASHGDVAVGYNAVIFDYEGGISEVGGLYVNQAFRGQGVTNAIKAELFTAIREADYIKKVVTFTNSSSRDLNLRLGFRRAERHEIPPQGLANCITDCDQFPKTKACGRLCCHEVLIVNAEDLPQLERVANLTRNA